MNEWVIYLLILLWAFLPLVFWKKSESNKKEVEFVYGKLYVRKTHKNSGPNPCGRVIEDIVSIEVSDNGNSLYISK